VVEAAGTPPSPRHNHTGDIIDNRLYIFGGGDENQEALNDLHVLDLRASRASHLTWLDVCGTTSHQRDRLGNQATMRWEQVTVHGEVPPARLYHCSAVVGRHLYIFGGAPDSKTTLVSDPVLNDMWRLDTRASLLLLSRREVLSETLT